MGGSNNNAIPGTSAKTSNVNKVDARQTRSKSKILTTKQAGNKLKLNKLIPSTGELVEPHDGIIVHATLGDESYANSDEEGELDAEQSQDSSGDEDGPELSQAGPNCTQAPSANLTSTPKQSKYGHLRNNPEFCKFVDEMVKERMGSQKGNHSILSRAQRSPRSRDLMDNVRESTPNRGEDNEGIEFGNERNHAVSKGPGDHQIIKSPSDSTLYTPALHQAKQGEINVLECISNFVDGMRIEDDNRRSRSRSKTPTPDRRTDNLV